MGDMTKTKGRLPWMKFNPTEWMGRCSELSDAELGLFHRVLEKLWATPGNALTKGELMLRMRIRPGDDRERLMESLFGYVLFVDEEGQAHIPELHDALAEAIARSQAGKAASAQRWRKEQAKQERAPGRSADIDF